MERIICPTILIVPIPFKIVMQNARQESTFWDTRAKLINNTRSVYFLATVGYLGILGLSEKTLHQQI